MYWAGNTGDPPPQYVLIDTAGTSWGGSPPSDAAVWAQRHYGPAYAVVHEAAGYQLARRV